MATPNPFLAAAPNLELWWQSSQKALATGKPVPAVPIAVTKVAPPPTVAKPLPAPAKRTYTPMESGNGSYIRADGSRFLSAKDIRFDMPGSVAAFYEWTGAQAKANLSKLYTERNQKAGGSAYIFGAVAKHAANNYAGNAEWDKLRAAVASGDFSKVSDSVALQALDFGFREQGRQQQHKSGFLNSVLGKVITLGAEVVATFATGNPWVGAAVGAGIGGVKDGWKGAALGAVEGYGVGKATQWVANGGLSNTWASVTGGGNPSSVAANAVPGARTGINSALPGMGGGLTTAQGAGLAPVTAIGPGGLNGAVLANAARLSDLAAGTGGLVVRGAQTFTAAGKPVVSTPKASTPSSSTSSLLNTGANVAGLLTGAAVTGAAAAAAGAVKAPSTPKPAAPPPASVTPPQPRQRQATRVVWTWDKPMNGQTNAPTLRAA